MNTNDTWRGLLVEARELLGDIWDASYEHDAGDALRALDIGERIDAALAEPVSGGVGEACPICDKGQLMHMKVCNLCDSQVADAEDARANKQAALNGGAVAGQDVEQISGHRRVCHACAGRERRYSCQICDCRHGRDACTCKPLESERGGE